MNKNYNNLINFADRLISNNYKIENGEFSINFENLDNDDKGKLTAHLIENYKRNPEFIVESDLLDEIVCELIMALKNQSIDSDISLAKTLKRAATKYFEESAKNLLEDRLTIFEDQVFHECLN